MAQKPKSWRDVLPIHPAAELFPRMSEAELKVLGEDIKKNGLQIPIALFKQSDNESVSLLDGRNRLDAMELAGIKFEVRFWEVVSISGWDVKAPSIPGTPANDCLVIESDPYAFVLAANIHRRHLTAERKRELIASILKATPDKSNRQIAETVRADHKTVASVRAEKEGRGEIPHVETRTDTAGRSQPAHKAAAEIALQRDDSGKLTPETKKALSPVIKELREEKTAEKKAERVEREAALGAKQLALPTKKYGVILSDCEWKFKVWSEGGLDRAADNHYPTSGLDVIKEREVPSIAAEDCVLFHWATVPMLPQALEVMAAWGFNYVSQFVWLKDKTGMGFWNRNQHEIVLIGTKGDIPAPAPGTQWPSAISAPVGEHSTKPEIFYQLIDAYFPTLPKIELNARRARDGWDCWGLEAPPSIPPEQIPTPTPPISDDLDIPTFLRREVTTT